MIDNITFDSKHEGARYSELKLMLGAGLISDLKDPSRLSDRPSKETRICDVILDFAYSKPNSVRIYEDAKGQDTDYSRLKRKLVEAFYGIKVEAHSLINAARGATRSDKDRAAPFINLGKQLGKERPKMKSAICFVFSSFIGHVLKPPTLESPSLVTITVAQSVRRISRDYNCTCQQSIINPCCPWWQPEMSAGGKGAG